MSVQTFPKRNDLVVATVKAVEDHGVVVSLDEYEGMEAYIPRSHVASGRIKDIRDFVKEGDKVVGRVIRADRKLGQVDLSLRYVSESERREKLEEWKERNRVLSLLRVAAQRAGYTEPEEVAKRALERLYEYYRDPLDALEDLIYEGASVLTEAGIEVKLAEELRAITESQLKPPLYVKNLVVKVMSYASDGIERVRRVLMRGAEAGKEAEVDVYAAGAPKYVISIRSRDPRAVKRAASSIIRAMERELGSSESFEVVEEREYRRRA
ncbi:MAG: S1 RNA-binding domain-containing protein [Candidatus Korarchaeum sp.]|nr:S1 RNA-binding domain-containing protein [Candidatus Korarchaeum sp.]